SKRKSPRPLPFPIPGFLLSAALTLRSWVVTLFGCTKWSIASVGSVADGPDQTTEPHLLWLPHHRSPPLSYSAHFSLFFLPLPTLIPICACRLLSHLPFCSQRCRLTTAVWYGAPRSRIPGFECFSTISWILLLFLQYSLPFVTEFTLTPHQDTLRPNIQPLNFSSPFHHVERHGLRKAPLPSHK
ncbi:hypothetical protein HOY82DRAFT_584720, partial [Tuber indicum]